MDAARAELQQLFADARGEKQALSKRIARLFDQVVAPMVLPRLQLDARARAACSREAWHAAACAPSLWAELDFERCTVSVTDAKLAALCARAGPALRTLRLDEAVCREVSGDGLVAALRNGGCAEVRRVFASSKRFGVVTQPKGVVTQATAPPWVRLTAMRRRPWWQAKRRRCGELAA